MNITRNYQSVLQQQQEPLNVIYVSSYIPRMCGIATYTKDLTNAINLLNSRSLAEILAVTRTDEDIEYPWESKFKIRHDELNTYLAAADYVNQSHADLVILQHEYGLFGGPYGEYIVSFVEALDRPLVTTFHTVLAEPSSKEVEILQRLAAKSEAIVVMMNSAAEMLTEHYGIDQEKIVFIPHGVPDFVFNDTATEKRKRQLSDRLVLGNINLLAPNKGIEYTIEAISLIAEKYPNVLGLIIGQTHPVLKQQADEKYRNFLKRRVRELGIEHNIRFINKYLSLKDLTSWLKTIDMYVTPYLTPQQITSGALAYAIGAGKACISTGYIYAKEVLADDRGIIVPFHDAEAIAEAVIHLQEHPEEKRAMEKRAYAFGRLMTWPNVAQSHLNLFRTILKNGAKSAVTAAPIATADSEEPTTNG